MKQFKIIMFLTLLFLWGCQEESLFTEESLETIVLTQEFSVEIFIQEANRTIEIFNKDFASINKPYKTTSISSFETRWESPDYNL